MISKAIKCIHCESKDIVKNGKHPNDKQRLKCKTCNKIFQEEYKNHGAKPQTKTLIVKISLNGSGIRDISRVLNISQNTVLSTLKNQKIPYKHKSKVFRPKTTIKNQTLDG